MRQAYTPALEVAERTVITKLRELPLKGTVLVSPGQVVTAEQPVLAADLPGEITIIRLADRLGFEPEDVARGLKVKPGDKVQPGQLLCEIKSFFNLFSTKYASNTKGTVEFFTEANGHLGIRQPPTLLEVRAYVDGRVVEIEERKSVSIESEGSLIQGIFGVGGERLGSILPLPVALDRRVQAADLEPFRPFAGKILIGGAAFTVEALTAAAAGNAAAVVTASVDSDTLGRFVGKEISVSVTGDESVPFTLIVTEGFGFLPLSPRIAELAVRLQGRRASVNGATQVRAGATRPEIIVPQPASADAAPSAQTIKSLEPGARVRLIRVPYFGRLGVIKSLPADSRRIATGAVVRVLEVELDGEKEPVVVPRANVELI